MKGAALIVNARSRTGREAFEKASRLLPSLDVEVGLSCALEDPDRLAEAVRRAIGEGHDPIVLGGGDGSVSSVIGSLADHHATLGLLPLGTANDFARTLEIPAILEEACETVVRSEIVDVDLGLAGSDFYVNVVSVGLGVGVTRALSTRMKKSLGPLAYPAAALKAFFKHEPFAARLHFPDGDHDPVGYDRLLQVAVGNGRFYGGGLVVSPDSGIDEGLFDVYAIRLGRHRDFVGVARYLKSGDFVNEECVDHFRTRRVLLTTEPELHLNMDSEVSEARTPREFSVARNALRVIVPESSTAAQLDVSGAS